MFADVIIVGGGPAGCATALSLIKSNPAATFLLVDDTSPNTYKIGESLPPEAIPVLKYLSPDISARVARPTHIPCTGNASVWESPQLRETYAMMNPFGSSWHLDRAAFDQGLRDGVLKARPGALVKARFVAVATEDNGFWVVTTQNSEAGAERQYRSRWLIDATGRKASVAQKLGAKTVKLDDVLAFYALFTSSSPSPDHDHRTLIEATPQGWLYSAQLPNHHRLVAFHTSGSSPASKLVRRLPGFLDLLSESSTYVREAIDQNDYHVDAADGWPKATAAGSSYLEPFGDGKKRWCAVGDAAIAFDPLSSQGMITALKSGCTVGIMLAKQLKGDPTVDMGSVQAVYDDVKKDYATKRQWFYRQSMFDGEDFWAKQKGDR
ncbi:hypothetical protein BC835DRAFT_113632 [Cytidiella melzeri]|nr:hypothetical protein BC835DRAFT_113632 [Cytidiella melzeri]